MSGKTLFGGLILSAALLAGPAAAQSRAEAQPAPQRASPAVLEARRTTQVDPPSLQVQLADDRVRAELEANLTGIPLDRVLAEARRPPILAPERAMRETQSEQDSRDRTVSRAEFDALASRPAPANVQPAPGNVVPPPRAAIRARVASAPASAGRVGPAPARTGQPLTPAPSANTELAAPPRPYLDVNGFGEDLHNALRNNVQGYTMRMRRNGQDIYTLQWNWARRLGDGNRGWNPDRRMNINSVSKFITAIAMVDLLDRRNIDPQTSIADWLPSYWTLGANVEDITFEMLMTHSSGLANSGSTDFPTMRQMVASGVTSNLPTAFTYENTNFGLQRILIATLGGYVSRTLNLGTPSLNDPVWDAITRIAYADYVIENVFAPAGVTGAGFVKDANTAFAYAYTGGNGWDTGDMSWRAGSGGWHLSVDEILDVAATYRYSGKIVSTGDAASAIASQYGLDGRVNTLAGPVYHKNGSWSEQSNCPTGLRQEQSLLMLLPDNMEMALLVNSPVGPSCTFLRGVVVQAIVSNIVEPDS